MVVMLIVALLHLRLKQLTIDMDTEQQQSPSDVQHQDGGLQFATHHVMQVLGNRLQRYWKIGIHWLTALKSLLAEPFDSRAIKILNSS